MIPHVIAEISQQLIDAQRPIRILDAIQWDPGVEDFLRASRFKEMPSMGPERYQAHKPLSFDPASQKLKLIEVRDQAYLRLGKQDRVAQLLGKIADEYRLAIEMLEARGTARFGKVARILYGSAHDVFWSDRSTVLDLGQWLAEIFTAMPEATVGPQGEVKSLDAAGAVRELQARLDHFFAPGVVEVKISDGIVADSAAGGESIKLKQGVSFSASDLGLLEVHEGWVHVATTLNGKAQPVAKWLAKGSPRVASTQEGLAVLMEILTFRSTPARARKINDRVLAIAMAEDGANLLEVIEFFRTQGYSEDDTLFSAQRVFRGGVLEGGSPFTKDLAYCKGFVENMDFMRTAVRMGRTALLPLFFCGKLHASDIPLLAELQAEGWLAAPRYLPEPFRDQNGLVVWLAFASFLNRLDLKRIPEQNKKES